MKKPLRPSALPAAVPSPQFFALKKRLLALGNRKGVKVIKVRKAKPGKSYYRVYIQGDDNA